MVLMLSKEFRKDDADHERIVILNQISSLYLVWNSRYETIGPGHEESSFIRLCFEDA